MPLLLRLNTGTTWTSGVYCNRKHDSILENLSLSYGNFKDLKKLDHVNRPLEKYFIFKNNWKSLKFMSNGGEQFLLMKKTLAVNKEAASLKAEKRGWFTTHNALGVRAERRGNAIWHRRAGTVLTLRRYVNCRLRNTRESIFCHT